MSEYINVSGIQLNNCTAKEAMQLAVSFMEEERLHVIEMATVDGLMPIMEKEEYVHEVRAFDLFLAGDETVLETAGVSDGQLLRDTCEKTFLKMYLQYLHKNHKRLYLLGETEEECTTYYRYFTRHYRDCQIVGVAKVAAADRADDMVVNAINGSECDCILSKLSAPLQEDFVIKNRRLLNARVWLGAGKNPLPYENRNSIGYRFGEFVMHHLFKKEIAKRKKNE